MGAIVQTRLAGLLHYRRTRQRSPCHSAASGTAQSRSPRGIVAEPVDSRQVREQSGIREVDLGCLHRTCRDVDVPARKHVNEEHLPEGVEVRAHCLVVDAHVSREPCAIQQRLRTSREQSNRALEGGDIANGSDVAQITIKQTGNVSFEEPASPPRRGGEHFGKATVDDPVGVRCEPGRR